jgi:hypothetical protein
MSGAMMLSCVACDGGTEYVDIFVAPSGTGSLGVGLSHYFTVLEQVEVSEIGDDNPTIEARPPQRIGVMVRSGTALAVGEVLADRASFRLDGVEPGTAVVTVSTNHDVTRDVAITVASVATTDLFVPRDLDAESELEPARSPVQVLVDSSFVVRQHHREAGGRYLIGTAPLTVDAGATAAAYDPSLAWYVSGDITGLASITALDTTLDLAIVDVSAIANIAVPDLRDGRLVVGLYDGSVSSYALVLPSDAAARPIVGAGPPCTVTISDSTVATVGSAALESARVIQITPLRRGTATLQVSWGSVVRSIPLVVQ